MYTNILAIVGRIGIRRIGMFFVSTVIFTVLAYFEYPALTFAPLHVASSLHFALQSLNSQNNKIFG